MSPVIGWQSLVSVAVVLALMVALAWLAKRGAFAGLRSRNRGIAIETALPLGERRSLVVVEVEGRRLLLGLTPASVSFVTELNPGQGRFEQELAKQQGAQPA